jgi:uncharacterized membrane protein
MNSSVLVGEMLALGVMIAVALMPALCGHLWHKER